MTLILHPEARDEMIESARYYARKVPGLGEDFLKAVDLAFDEVVGAPLRWRVVALDVRRYVLSRFPFGILYQIRLDRVNVIAVAHFSRHPDYWKDRID
jgi:toxin ParE1/3/4